LPFALVADERADTVRSTTVYWLAVACHLDRLPVSTIVYYGLTGPMGFLMLILATFVTIRRERRG
jgi:hypothetical protein